ncbi:IS21 family transposase, partial [Pseudomonas citronellolis]
HAAGGGLESDRHAGNHANTVDYRVVSLTQRRLADPATVIAGLPPDTRPLPDVAAYDELLQRRPPTPPPGDGMEGTTGS